MADETAFAALAEELGIVPRYHDIWGAEWVVPSDTMLAVFAALGFPVSGADDAAAALTALRRERAERVLEPVVVTREDQHPTTIAVTLPTGREEDRVFWSLTLERGARRSGHARVAEMALEDRIEVEGQVFERRRLALAGDLPLGYHDLSLSVGREEGQGEAASTRLIVAPRRAYHSPGLEKGERVWGAAAQLYSLRSPRNWGIGDFTDLARLADHVARAGGDAVGLNPLHSLFLDEPHRPSPYGPSSRIFVNPLYLDIERIADFAECDEAQALVETAAFRERLAALRASELVDYAGVAACKLPVLELLYQSFRARHLDSEGDSERAAAFRRFQHARGRVLRRFATFEALRESFGRDDPALRYWRRWPEDLRHPDAPAVAAFARRNERRVEFYEYLQWQAEDQFADSAGGMRARGMEVGCYADLALGVDGGGADAWAEQDLFVSAMSVGAPPDDWNVEGQNWGFPPANPRRMRRTGYEHFIEVLRANMRHAGALRIDHVLGFMRLFWIPEGVPAKAGAYVRYPFEEMLGILALESRRNRCLVIGEDLGTVPEGLRLALQEAGVLSYRLLYFERDATGNFLAPEDYPAAALVAVGTHDLPPLSGYWQGRDIEVKRALGFFARRDLYDEASRSRELDRARLTAALRDQGLLAGGDVPIEAPVEAAHRFLSRTPAMLMVVHFEDLLGVVEQVNVPATSDEHPNWRRRLPLCLDDLFADPRVVQILRAVSEARPSLAAMRATAGRGPPPPAVPDATYRLQFRRDFGFADAEAVVDYLAALGISHIYASPYLSARPGSGHGYDITDHNALNPELGSWPAYERFCAALARRGMGQIMDFVPNHMGIGRNDNAWWLDVLEWGRASSFAAFFDIDWMPRKRELHGKVLVPFLADHYGAVIEAGELRPRFDARAGAFSVWYHEHRFPIRPRDYGVLLRAALDREGRLGVGEESVAVLERLAHDFATLRTEGLSLRRQARVRVRAQTLKWDLSRLAATDPAVTRLLDAAARDFSGEAGRAETMLPLHRLLERQAYRLAYWRVAADEINYRRFFDINELAGIRVDEPALFDAIHRLVARLVGEGKLHGLRIDHIDGLFDPAAYCRRLQDQIGRLAPSGPVGGEGGPPFYVLVEKILARHERLRDDWPVAGTTGYEFAALVNGLFVDPAGERPLAAAYRRFTGMRESFDEVLYHCRRQIIETALASELNVLANDLDRLSEQYWRTRDFTLERLRAALIEVVAAFPVYRTYVDGAGADERDRREIDWAMAKARQRWRGPDPEVLDFVHGAILGEPPGGAGTRRERAQFRRFAMKVQQYTGPVTAKSLEDTALYRYHRLDALNEVGGDPRQFATTVAAFHHLNQERLRAWPHTLLATATHDTKRGEDVRARLDVLSEMPREWATRVRRWARLNRSLARRPSSGETPSRNDVYMIYQTLVGAWPAELSHDRPPDTVPEDFVRRIEAYVVKAMREAKLRTSWTNPNAAYEAACTDFVRRVLDPERAAAFLADFCPFQARVARLGALNSLSQTVLKLTAPGVPDIYQGGELWDLSLVDPDNRRAVDFTRRARLLEAFAALSEGEHGKKAAALLADWRNGAIKFYLIWRLLALRRARRELFASGDYEPLEVTGDCAPHVVAFARRRGDQVVIVAVGRLFAALVGDGDDQGASTGPGACTGDAWGATLVAAPRDAPRRFRSVLTGDLVTAEADDGRAYFSAPELFSRLPVAVLVGGETGGEATSASHDE